MDHPTTMRSEEVIGKQIIPALAELWERRYGSGGEGVVSRPGGRCGSH